MSYNKNRSGWGRLSEESNSHSVVIPMSVVKEHFSNWSDAGSTIGSSSTATGMKTIKGVKLVKCPYDNTHIISENKMFSHLEKCRRNYEEWRINRGVSIIEVTCMYNHHHRVLPPELESHQETCPNREIPSMLTDDKAPASQESEGRFIDKYFGGTIPSLEPLPLWQVARMASNKGRDVVRGKAMAGIRKNSLPPVSISCQRSQVSEALGDNVTLLEWEESSSNMSAAASTLSFSGAQASAQEGDSEGFWRRGHAAPYNFLEDAMNPTCVNANGYPPGLNRPQRRQYDDWRRQWIRNIQEFEAQKAGQVGGRR